MHGVSLRLKLDFKVPIAELKPCVAKVIPDWRWRKVKHEKWVVHLDYNGIILQRKIGEKRKK